MTKRYANLRFKDYRQGDLASLAMYVVDTKGKNGDVFATPAPSLVEKFSHDL